MASACITFIVLSQNHSIQHDSTTLSPIICKFVWFVKRYECCFLLFSDFRRESFVHSAGFRRRARRICGLCRLRTFEKLYKSHKLSRIPAPAPAAVSHNTWFRSAAPYAGTFTALPQRRHRQLPWMMQHPRAPLPLFPGRCILPAQLFSATETLTNQP